MRPVDAETTPSGAGPDPTVRTDTPADLQRDLAGGRDLELHDRLLAQDLRQEQRLPWLVVAALTIVAAVAFLHVLLLAVRG